MRRKAFTIIEVLIVAGVVGILAALSMPSAHLFLSRNELNTEALKMTDAFRRARSQAMSAQEDSAWGVHITASGYIVFRGNSYDPADAFNDEVALPGVLTVSVIDINGGGGDVIFDRIIGTTSNFGTTTIQNDVSETRTIVVNEAGTINLQ